jgi:hypothetical protein
LDQFVFHGAAGGVGTVADVVAPAAPLADDQIGELGATVFQHAVAGAGTAIKRTGRLEVALRDKSIAVGPQIVIIKDRWMMILLSADISIGI